MKELSKIALAIQPSTTLAIDSMFKQMKAEGQDVVGFGSVATRRSLHRQNAALQSLTDCLSASMRTMFPGASPMNAFPL